MNYKVIEYRCGCKYILLSDKSIFKGGKCPTHWQNQESVTLWCLDCGEKLTVKPQVGHRQMRCYECSKQYQLEANRKNWREKYRNRYKQNSQIRYSTKEPEKTKAKRIIGKVFAEIHENYGPFWEGVILVSNLG